MATAGRTVVGEYPLTQTLDDALSRVRELSERLWAVRDSHPPVRTRFRRICRCATCRAPWPCPTIQAADNRRQRATAS